MKRYVMQEMGGPVAGRNRVLNTLGLIPMLSDRSDRQMLTIRLLLVIIAMLVILVAILIIR